MNQDTQRIKNGTPLPRLKKFRDFINDLNNGTSGPQKKVRTPVANKTKRHGSVIAIIREIGRTKNNEGMIR